jgi:branched-chain amino acid transport system substrate-binding protein
MEQLKGRKIVHVYHDSDVGRETIPLLDTQAAHYGFAVQHLAVKPPGSTRRRPGCGSRWRSPTGSSCAPKAS